MSLYDRIIEEAKKQMPQQSIYGVDMSIAFKLLCDEVEKLQNKLPDGVNETFKRMAVKDEINL